MQNRPFGTAFPSYGHYPLQHHAHANVNAYGYPSQQQQQQHYSAYQHQQQAHQGVAHNDWMSHSQSHGAVPLSSSRLGLGQASYDGFARHAPAPAQQVAPFPTTGSQEAAYYAAAAAHQAQAQVQQNAGGYAAYGHAQSVYSDLPNRAGASRASGSSNNEERAHLDRLFSALAASQAPSSLSSLSHGHHHGGYEQQQLYGVPPHQTHAHNNTGDVLSAPHQGTGLQPAFDFGDAAFINGHSHTLAHLESEQQVLPVSAVRYHEALLEHEREQARQAGFVDSSIPESAFHPDLGIAVAHQQHAQAQAQAQAQADFQAQAQAQAQMEICNVVLPDKETTLDDEPQLIPADASAIPPPPTIEKSAHPLAALATDLVWDAFLSAASSNSGLSLSASSGSSPSMPSSGSASPIYHRDADRIINSSSTSPFTGFGGISTHLASAPSNNPRTPASAAGAAIGRRTHGRNTSRSLSPGVAGRNERSSSVPQEDSLPVVVKNTFGAIGGERKPRAGASAITSHNVSRATSTPLTGASPTSRSDSSSPASTAPGTPILDGANVNCIVKTSSESSLGTRINGKRLSAGHGAPYWTAGVGDDEALYGGGAASSKDMLSTLSTSHHGYLRKSTHQQQQSNRHLLTPPKALFEQIQKLLGATLLSQQVLLLALYFVAKTPHTCPLYPPATSQSALKSTSAPFKLLLAALVVANKHLDDNSFRNSTFAQVANVALPEVNALEFSMLSSLEFDINVSSSDWLAWLRDLQYQRTTHFSSASSTEQPVSSIIGAILQGVEDHQVEHARLFSPRLRTERLDDEQLRQPVSSDVAASVNQKASSSAKKSKSKKGDASIMDIAMIPLAHSPPTASVSPGHDSHTEVDESIFDMDAAGPLEKESRPRYYSKAFGAPPMPSPLVLKQAQYHHHQQQQQHQQQVQHPYAASWSRHPSQDTSMFDASRYADDVAIAPFRGYPDWNAMPEVRHYMPQTAF